MPRKKGISTFVFALAVVLCVQSLLAQTANLATERFAGDYRAIPKTTIARNGATIVSVKQYNNLHSLLVTLPDDAAIRSKYPGLRKSIKKNWPPHREPEEIRNVRIKSCWIVSAKHEGGADGDRDFHVIVSNSPTNFGEVMNAEISGLPHPSRPDFNKLKAVRALFLSLATNPPPGSSFGHMNPPKHVMLEGSLYFDGYHGAGGTHDPGPAWAKPQSVWEIHPIYKLTTLP